MYYILETDNKKNSITMKKKSLCVPGGWHTPPNSWDRAPVLRILLDLVLYIFSSGGSFVFCKISLVKKNDNSKETIFMGSVSCSRKLLNLKRGSWKPLIYS